MSLNLTYIDNKDAVLRYTRQHASKIIAAALFLLLLAAVFGVMFLDPIRAY